MRFEHLIEINNPANPTIPPLTREQLWRGLVTRAENPKLFVAHLDACEIVERTDVMLTRKLTYGQVEIHDRVTYLAQHQVRYHIAAQLEFSDAMLTMTIEEPQPGTMFVRFEYEDDSPDDGVDAMYNDFRRSAYKESDIDTIHVIRQLAAQGRI